MTLVTSSKERLTNAKDMTLTAINNVMKTRIPADEVEDAKNRVQDELMYTNITGDLRTASIELARFAIVQNVFFDPEKTQELKKQARESVEPVKILQGQIIVEENQLINPKYTDSWNLSVCLTRNVPFSLTPVWHWRSSFFWELFITIFMNSMLKEKQSKTICSFSR